MGGEIFARDLDGWHVSWESAGAHRHWCVQRKPGHRERIVVVLKNPGSLSGDGRDLRRDTTLRILRRVGEAVRADWLIVNLFDYAAPDPRDLHANWLRRDRRSLVFPRLDLRGARFLVVAHGDFGVDHARAFAARAAFVRKALAPLREIAIPRTKAGNGVHPINWQRLRLLPRVIDAIGAATRGRDDGLHPHQSR
jgi:hypothetical protein